MFRKWPVNRAEAAGMLVVESMVAGILLVTGNGFRYHSTTTIDEVWQRGCETGPVRDYTIRPYV